MTRNSERISRSLLRGSRAIIHSALWKDLNEKLPDLSPSLKQALTFSND
jgi:hypothetical protein